MEKIIAALCDYRYDYSTEEKFQDGIGKALANAKINFDTEYRLSANSTVDFFVDGVGIEAKIKGNRHAVLRQLARYAKSPDIRTLILATTKKQLLNGFPESLEGKPIVGQYLGNPF